MAIKAVFFDVDGVLLDSLPQHLQICRDKAKEFGLNLSIPDVNEFRRMCSEGIKITPMRNFFQAVGFPEREALVAVADYDRDFATKYRTELFPGVVTTLRLLVGRGVPLGLVTANTRNNVEQSMGGCLEYFEPTCRFFLDGRTKSDHLIQGAANLHLNPAQCLYVGDQISDRVAADKAGFQFVGATYGWGILPHYRHGKTINHPSEILRWVSDR